MAMLLKYRESQRTRDELMLDRRIAVTHAPPTTPRIEIAPMPPFMASSDTSFPPRITNTSDDASNMNIVRRKSLLTPEPLPRPEPNKHNMPGQQKHQVEMRSGGVIAFRVPLYQKMVVGGISGVIGLSAIFPIDVIKTRIQLFSSNIGISGVCRDVFYKHGVTGFYRGLPATAAMTAPEKAIKLGVNDYLRDVFCNFDRNQETIPQQVMAGALTGVVQVAVTNPLEVTKIRLQTAESGQTPLQTIKELGIHGLYKGSSVTLMRDVPYNIIFFLSYIEIKRSLTSETGDISRQSILGSGVLAGMLAAFFGTPADVVKSRIQMKDSVYNNGAADCAKRLYSEGGAGIFFRGALPRMMVQGPLYGIALLCFEMQSQYLGSSDSR